MRWVRKIETKSHSIPVIMRVLCVSLVYHFCCVVLLQSTGSSPCSSVLFENLCENQTVIDTIILLTSSSSYSSNCMRSNSSQNSRVEGAAVSLRSSVVKTADTGSVSIKSIDNFMSGRTRVASQRRFLAFYWLNFYTAVKHLLSSSTEQIVPYGRSTRYSRTFHAPRTTSLAIDRTASYYQQNPLCRF